MPSGWYGRQVLARQGYLTVGFVINTSNQLIGEKRKFLTLTISTNLESGHFNLRLRSPHYSPGEKSLWVNKTKSLSKTEPWLHLSGRHKLSKNLASPGLMLIGVRLARYKKTSWSQTRQSSSTPIPLVRIFICLFCTN